MDSDVIVETNLDEEVEYRGKSFVRHARTRIVERRPLASIDPPKPGDPWCPLTVRARLQRMAEVFRRLPHDPDTRPAIERSCMPQPVREIFKDLPGDPMRIPVGQVDHRAAMQVLDSLITLTTEQRWLAWAIATRLDDTKTGRGLNLSNKTARLRKLTLLDQLVVDWTARGWMPELADIVLASSFIHRNLK